MSGCTQFITVPVIYKDGELLPCVQDLMLDASCIVIEGTRTKPAWDPVNWVFVSATGVFIEYQGIEYGVVISEDALFQLIYAACESATGFRLFDYEFDFEFE